MAVPSGTVPPNPRGLEWLVVPASEGRLSIVRCTRRLAFAAALLGLACTPALSAEASGAPACRAGDLSGVFAVVNGSAGAGSISYDLRLQNHSSSKCYVSGIPGLRLLGKTGKALPTKVVPDRPGALTAAKIILKPGGYAASTARFSPDIPGTGEAQYGQCEPTAHSLRVSPAGGGSLVVPVKPATPVCEHGRMVLTALIAGKHGSRS